MDFDHSYVNIKVIAIKNHLLSTDNSYGITGISTVSILMNH